MFCHGAKVGFYQGDISLLMDDIKTLKPTFFPVVPRLLNRIYDKVSGDIQILRFTAALITYHHLIRAGGEKTHLFFLLNISVRDNFLKYTKL